MAFEATKEPSGTFLLAAKTPGVRGNAKRYRNKKNLLKPFAKSRGNLSNKASLGAIIFYLRAFVKSSRNEKIHINKINLTF
ncbi:MAG: hypothetical protein LBE38_01950 [Deltaproteobacteria bacterium]|jgi:hypothetical protein|nr:hypothetical protein [Deltaproteobacteria bacterium]